MERGFRQGYYWLIDCIVSCILLTLLLLGNVNSHSLAVASGSSGNFFTYLPIAASADILLPSEEAIFRIDPGGGLNGSTFTPASFSLTNVASNSQPIRHIRIDLSTAFLPDMVFDPNGSGGDTVAKDLQINSNSAVYVSRSFSNPHAGGGFDALQINFSGFDPGESFTFSIDVDPTSIKGTGAPGPNDSGSVSGVELIGTTVSVTFADGTVISGQPYRIEGSLSGSEVLIREGLPPAPTITLVGTTSPPATVSEANQTIRITSAPNRLVRLLLVEGGLFTAGVPGGGFDLDAFEANSALSIQEYSAISDANGNVDIPITLLQSQAEGGLNYMMVVQENSFKMKGVVSAPIILEYETP